MLPSICRVFFSCCDSAASPQATVWAPAWAPRSRTRARVDNRASTPEATPRLCAAGAGGATTAKTSICAAKLQTSPQLFEGTSPRRLYCLCADETGNIYSVLLLICRVFFFFCCDSYNTWRHLATAKSPILRRHISALSVFQLVCRMPFSCCGSVALPQATVLCANEADSINFVLLLICRVLFF